MLGIWPADFSSVEGNRIELEMTFNRRLAGGSLPGADVEEQTVLL